MWAVVGIEIQPVMGVYVPAFLINYSSNAYTANF